MDSWATAGEAAQPRRAAARIGRPGKPGILLHSVMELGSATPHRSAPASGYVAWPGSNGRSAWLSMPAIVFRYRLAGPCALMICWKAACSLLLQLPAELRAATKVMFSR